MSTGQSPAWYAAPLLIGPLVVLYMLLRVVKEWLSSRDYRKMVAARRRRMPH